MYCSNCGNQLQDGTNFCPECGERIGSSNDAIYPVENIQICNISITRDNAAASSAVKMKVYIDGLTVGTLACGKTIFIPCEYGEHSLTVVLHSYEITRLIYVPDDAEFSVTVNLHGNPEFKLTSFASSSLSKATAQMPTTQPAHRNVYTNPASHKGKEKNKWVAFLLCIFLGALGFHKFYEGKVITGILYLCTFGLFGFGVLIDAIILLCKPNPYYV